MARQLLSIVLSASLLLVSWPAGAAGVFKTAVPANERIAGGWRVDGPYELFSLAKEGGLREEPFAPEELSNLAYETARFLRTQETDGPIEARWDSASKTVRLGLPSGAAAAIRPEEAPKSFRSAEEEARVRELGRGLDPNRLYDYAFANGRNFVVVGSVASRPWGVEAPVRVAKELGLKLFYVDEEKGRANTAAEVPDAHFVAAPVFEHKPENLRANSKAAAEALSHLAGPDTVVYGFFGPFMEFVAHLADRLGAVGPSLKAMEASMTKNLAREIWNKDPELEVGHRVIHDEKEAAQGFREVGGDAVVIKPIHSAGGAVTTTDVASEERAVAVYRETDALLANAMKSANARLEGLDDPRGIIMERQLEGPEFDLEFIGDRRGRPRFFFPSDNPPSTIRAVEKGSTYPSQLPLALQRQHLERAWKAIRMLGLDGRGNNHYESKHTADGAKGIENNPRMGGFYAQPDYKKITGVDLIEEAMRSWLGLPVRGDYTIDGVYENRQTIAQVSGTIIAIDGVEEAKRAAGMESFRLLKKVGDRAAAPPEETIDYILDILVKGKDYDEAFDRTLAALKLVRIKIRADDGRIVEQGGDYTHTKAPLADQLAAVAKKKSRASGILESYYKGQTFLALGFVLYYALYAPLTTAVASLGAGLAAGLSAYYLSIAIFSPIAGLLAERLSMRKILIGSAAARAAVWAALWAGWELFGPTAWLFIPFFAGLRFLDGIAVSFTNVVDMDQGGPDILARQHGFKMTPEIRKSFNARWESFEAKSWIVVAPIVAAGVYALSWLHVPAAEILLGLMVSSFGANAALSIWHYHRGIPAKANLAAAPSRPLGAEIRAMAADFIDGFKKAWKNTGIRGRLSLYPFEKAMEDSMALLVLSAFAIELLAAGDPVLGGVFAALLIPVGQVGRIIGSWWMEHRWKAPASHEEDARAYRIFFPLAFVAAASMLGVPLAYWVASAGSWWAGAGIAAASSFSFFLFYSMAAQGFRNYMQGAMDEAGALGRIPGIATTMVGVTGAVVTGGLSLLLAALPTLPALIAIAGFFTAVGAFIMIFAPRLLFGPSKP